ncbi:MAG: CaiB/BaiF CoA-transferase family protein [Actinomycetota bacterium]|jgi:alpha-methylacyl-CoA racemase|nr:CaiB/BaiF CoA-transferase family protein [Actinomycetota bacterium]
MAEPEHLGPVAAGGVQPPDAVTPPRGGGPLAGTVVLDLSTVGPASRCTRLLADYGATVVKVSAPPASGAAPISPPYYAYSGGHGMRRVLVDLKTDAGRRAFLALAARADVVVESFRPGVVDRLGIGYEDVAACNPAVVYCSTSGYGQDGPRAGWAGHDICYLAVGGYLAMSEPRADGGPPLPGATVADAAGGGMHAALAICAALAGRAATGEGAYLDVSVADGVLWLMSLSVDEHLATGAEPAPGHDILSGRYACYGTYRAGDGRWLAVGAIESKFFANLCRALGCEQWVDHQLDDSVQEQIRADFAAAFATGDRDQWVQSLGGSDTCVAPVLAVAEIPGDEQFAWRGAVAPAVHPEHGPLRQVAPVLAGMVHESGPVALPDPGSTDTEDLLIAAGVGAGEVAAWRAAGVIA